MAQSKTIHINHLGGTDAGYAMPHPYDPHKPTLILVNSFCTSAELYRSQFDNKQLTDAMNLLAIEPLGHGSTRTKRQHYTYWDTAIMNIEVMEKLGINKAFVLGTSQGGWITVRMALLAPNKIEGIIPLGTSMDAESARTIKLGCWDGVAACTPLIDGWTTAESTPDFKTPPDFCEFLMKAGFGPRVTEDDRKKWSELLEKNYEGDAGRRRARMASINLRDRDGLHARLFDVKCPVLWMHGTADEVYSVANAEEEIKLFVNSIDAKLIPVEGGSHFLNYSDPKVVDENVLKFVTRYQSQVKTRV